jgi:hypothetical protein
LAVVQLPLLGGVLTVQPLHLSEDLGVRIRHLFSP